MSEKVVDMQVHAARRGRRERAGAAEFQDVLRALDPNLQQVLAAELLKQAPLDKMIRRLGRGRRWLQHIQSMLLYWPGLRYTIRAFMCTVGTELLAPHSHTLLVDDTFRRFDLHLEEVDGRPYSGHGDPVAEYMSQPAAYRMLIDLMTDAMRHASTVRCVAGATQWTLDQGPFEPWRNAFGGSMKVLPRTDAPPLSGEDLRQKFMILPELDLYHGRFTDDMAGSAV